MKYIVWFLAIALLSVAPSFAATAGNGSAEHGCESDAMNKECESGPGWCKKGDGECRSGKRGSCGKRRGDWYGARQPVATVAQAQQLLEQYYAGQEYRVTRVAEQKWGYTAELRDKNGSLIDTVLINKRSGRVRSLN